MASFGNLPGRETSRLQAISDTRFPQPYEARMFLVSLSYPIPKIKTGPFPSGEIYISASILSNKILGNLRQDPLMIYVGNPQWMYYPPPFYNQPVQASALKNYPPQKKLGPVLPGPTTHKQIPYTTPQPDSGVDCEVIHNREQTQLRYI